MRILSNVETIQIGAGVKLSLIISNLYYLDDLTPDMEIQKAGCIGAIETGITGAFVCVGLFSLISQSLVIGSSTGILVGGILGGVGGYYFYSELERNRMDWFAY